jgi:hypothetical protein
MIVVDSVDQAVGYLAERHVIAKITSTYSGMTRE